MVNPLGNSRKDLQMALLHEAIDFEYRYRRYEINYSIAIGLTTEEIDMSALSSFIRSSDRFVVLTPNICAVILDSAGDQEGIKAANNLLTYFQNHFFGHTLYAAVSTASNHLDAAQLIHEAFDLLEYAISNNMNNLVVDSSQVIAPN